ncbi:MAG: DUF4173 domain-containing protein [Clostridiales bacterium]|jgi:hypothetical protein|nr:DUF4173 domain-containing protein [Clostridiales bacterium]
MNGNNIQTAVADAEVLPQPNKPADKPPAEITRDRARVVLPVGIIAALLYTVCFSGSRVFPQVSFTLFCAAAFLLLTGTLKALKLFKNKRAYLWALPMALLAACNGIFDANFFTWVNALIMHGLFAAYTLTALSEGTVDLFNPGGFFYVIAVTWGNWTAFAGAIKALAPGKRSGASGNIPKIILGTVAATPVLFVVVALLSSADAVFNRYVGRVFSSLIDAERVNIPFIISLIISFVYLTGYVFAGIKNSRSISPADFPAIKTDTTACATFLILLNMVFALFTVVQCAFLFSGGFFELPGGMVYSRYAREGFFQLLFVTFINFAVIIIFVTSLRDKAREPLHRRPVIRALLFALCFFTGVLIVSSCYRMGMYTGAYGHTTLRLSVYTFLCMETVMLAATVWKLISGGLRYVRALVLIGLAFYIIVNFTGSDYFSTQLNKQLYLAGRLDYIDMNRASVGTDGLTVLKPLFDSGEYVCVDYKLFDRASYESNAWPFEKYPSAGETDYRPMTWEKLYMDHYANHRDEDKVKFPWQNNTLLKINPEKVR